MFETFRNMGLDEENILKTCIDYIEESKRKEIKILTIEWRQILITMMHDLLQEKITVYMKII